VHGTIRDATDDDAAACADIYAPYVAETTVSFEDEPPSAHEMGRRIAQARQAHAWLVLEEDGEVIGYAYAAPVKQRAAYRWSCEVSVYLARGRSGAGRGRALYEALFARLAERGYRQAVAGMTLPNDASAGLHRALGFEPIGVQRRIGWKHGGWRDVAWLQRPLSDDDGPPDALR
jgi:L-amino acid N-acyltransferase YncA